MAGKAGREGGRGENEGRAGKETRGEGERGRK